MKTLKLLIWILIPAVLMSGIFLFQGCDEESPIVPPSGKLEINLTVDESGLTRIVLKIELTDTVSGKSVQITRDGNAVFDFSLQGSDTTVTDANLQSNTSYSYKAYLNVNSEVVDSSGLLVATTLPDLFPLITGRVIVYGEGTLLFLDTQDPITGTEVGFNSKWIVAGNFPLPIPPHTNPVLVLDTTNVPAAGVSNAVRQFFIQKDTVTGNFDFLTNLGYLFRSQKIYNTPGDSTSGIRGDSLVWIGLAKPTEGIGNEWTAYTANYTSATLGNIRFDIVGEFEAKETLSIAGTNYETYKLVATRKVYIGSVVVSQGVTAILWLAPDIGPVKIILIGDAESHGKSQTMTAKNF